MKKILLMKFRNIGDVLLLTPLIANLKRNFPDSEIDVALNKGTEEMVTLSPHVNNVLIYDRLRIKSLNIFSRVLAEIKYGLYVRSRKYDIVVNTTEGDRGTQLALISGAKIKIGYAPEGSKFRRAIFNLALPEISRKHMVDVNLDVLRALNLPIKEKKVEIFTSNEDEVKIEEILTDNSLENEGFILIHPVSRWMFKCIDDHVMANVIDYCELSLKAKVIVTASSDKKEQEKINSILSICRSVPVNLAGKLNLKQVAVLAMRATCFVGVDTAVMHIAAAQNTAVLAFFGPSSTSNWGPWDNELLNNGYTQLNGVQTMGRNMVVQQNWECIPCRKDGCNGSKISNCLIGSSLNIEFIKSRIKKMLVDETI